LQRLAVSRCCGVYKTTIASCRGQIPKNRKEPNYNFMI